MDEIVDIVDERDQVVGQCALSEAHAKNLLHRSVSIIIFKDENRNEMLLQTRAKHLLHKPGKFCFVGGHVKSGEIYEQAAIRELLEEMFSGIEPPLEIHLKLLGVFRKNGGGDKEFKALFEWVYPGPFSFDPGEVDSWRFRNVLILEEEMEVFPEKFTETIIESYRKYKESLG